jgi:predicted SnoaL-like aldol condensation-catalyzing enzyme
VDAAPGEVVRGYLERVVNGRDITAVEDTVAPGYRGTGPGWPATVEALRAFYLEQYRARPDWRIDVEATLELGDAVVVRAHAQGRIADEPGQPVKAVRWLAHYRLDDGRISRIDLLGLLPDTPRPAGP